MKYIRQFSIIMLYSLAAELCHIMFPVSIPSSIYGMLLLFLSFLFKLLKIEAVKETGSFLVSLLPLLFVVPTVGLMTCWELIRDSILQITILIAVTTVLTFGVSGLLTKQFCKGGATND